MEQHQNKGRPFRQRRRPRKKPQETEEFISPLDFLDLESDGSQPGTEAADASRHHQGIFIIGTDTGVGKTVAVCALGALLKQRGLQAGVMKPIDCGAEDMKVFQDACHAGTFSSAGCVYSFREKISPYFAFKKNHAVFDMEKTVQVCRQAVEENDVTLIEGPGGLCDPLTEKQTVADLIKALGLKVVVAAPLRRGTLNHLAMLAGQARACGVEIQGVLLTETQRSIPKAYFLAKIQAVREVAGLAVLGIIPFLEKGTPEEVLERCHQKVSFKLLLNLPENTTPQAHPGQETAAVPQEGGNPAEKPRRRPSSSRGRRRRRVVRKPEA